MQVKMFDDYETEAIQHMNDFMQNVYVVDVKMNTVTSATGVFFTRYLVLYKKPVYAGDKIKQILNDKKDR